MAALESQLTALQKEKNESITSLEKQRNTLLRKYKKAKSEIERLRVDLERAKVGLHTYMDKPSPVHCLMSPRCVVYKRHTVHTYIQWNLSIKDTLNIRTTLE